MTDRIEFRPTAEQLSYTFGGRPPVATVRPGDTLVVSTEDCFGGAVKSVDDLPSQVCAFPYLNPVTGPFYRRGRRAGRHPRACTSSSITPARDWAVSALPALRGADLHPHTATLQPPLDERVWRLRHRLRRRRGPIPGPHAPTTRWSCRWTRCTARSASRRRRSRPAPRIAPDAHGGNMDTPELRAGTTAVPRRQRARGAARPRRRARPPGRGRGLRRRRRGRHDHHARRRPHQRRRHAVAAARVRHPHHDAIGCARPLEDAYRISQHDLISWTAELTGLDTLDAYQLVSQAGRRRSATSATPTTRCWPSSTSATCSRPARTTVSTPGCAASWWHKPLAIPTARTLRSGPTR